MRLGHGWSQHTSAGVTLWLKGFTNDSTGQSLADQLSAAVVSTQWLNTWLQGHRGHFAIVATGPGWALASCDRTRSTPLFYSVADTHTAIAAHAPALVEHLNLGIGDIDRAGALAIAMSGYAAGNDTLYGPMKQLRPGEAVLIDLDGQHNLRWHIYRPWMVEARSNDEMIAQLTEVTLAILRRVIAQANGRQIAVPLSAGLDSRLIASGLVHLGYRNIKCFSYGQSGNHEAHAASRIAERLKLPWRFLPNTHGAQAAYFTSRLHSDYVRFADSCAGSAFMQDLPPLKQLLDEGWIAPDAIIINGNSGDFISGGHVPATALSMSADKDGRWKRLFASYVKKHLSLWSSLQTSENLDRMEQRLLFELRQAGAALDAPDCDHGCYEFLEFQDRQCKWVISGQRIYDFLDLDWRLPLWDDDYLDFWQTVPVEAKLGQRLYRDMLLANDWGGVWRDFHAPRWPQPRWLQPIRLALKAMHAPFGTARWHDFERQYIHYWMSSTCNYAVVPYSKVALDRRGHRNGISFQNEAYLGTKGLDYRGQPHASQVMPGTTR